MDKMKLAHDWYMKHSESSNFMYSEVGQAWEYADAMQAEAEEREKAEAAQKRKEMREMLNAPNTFVEREGQHFDDIEEWQPDWSQAPEWAVAWTYDKDGALWWSEIPEMHKNIWDGRVQACANAPSFGYQGDWRESLRRRPQ